MRNCAIECFYESPFTDFAFHTASHIPPADCGTDWFMRTFNKCVDVNPNSNGALSQDQVARRKDFGINDLSTKKSPAANASDKSAWGRNLKKFANCINAIHTDAQEKVLEDHLITALEEILKLDASNNGKPRGTKLDASDEGEQGDSPTINALMPPTLSDWVMKQPNESEDYTIEGCINGEEKDPRFLTSVQDKDGLDVDIEDAGTGDYVFTESGDYWVLGSPHSGSGSQSIISQLSSFPRRETNPNYHRKKPAGELFANGQGKTSSRR